MTLLGFLRDMHYIQISATPNIDKCTTARSLGQCPDEAAHIKHPLNYDTAQFQYSRTAISY